MSGFERALLEGKERDELIQIAESLGKKPPARAKKATIIDLIFELAGVTEAAAEPSPEPSAGAADAPAEPGDEEESEVEVEGEGGGQDEGDVASSDAAAPPADGADAGGEAGPGSRRRGRNGQAGGDGGRSRAGGGQGDRSGQPTQGGTANQGGNANQGDGGRSRRDQGGDPGPGNEADRAGGDDQGSGSDDPNQNPNHQVTGNEEDSDGNRRRRRRGRNRDNQAGDAFEGDPVEVEGLLDLRDDGYGFLRLKDYLPSTADVYVSVKQVRQLGLRKGDLVTGKSRPASRNEKNPALLQIDKVNGQDPSAASERRRFEALTPLFPDERLTLETQGAAAEMSTRIIDLLAPIGKGQRGLIVSPPKAGKTTIMKQIARAIELNHPEVELVVLLVDERPEEVTDMKRWLIRGEVAASTFDRPSEEHIQVAELVLERAKRQVETGKDVVIILDGITRLARAYNLAQPPSGRIMSGGIDAAALYPPKRFFGAARNAEEGGSLTIVATALVETGSKMDEHIFEEFKGTGNMELRLDRHLAERRVFPAIDVDASSTRHEELLFERRQVAQVDKLRKVLGALKDSEGASDAAALNLLLDRMKQFKTNADFLAEIAKAAAPG